MDYSRKLGKKQYENRRCMPGIVCLIFFSLYPQKFLDTLRPIG